MVEKSVRAWFQSWIDKDPMVLENVFSEKIVYVECYGPEYHGLEQIRKWFRQWNEKGTVFQWEINRIFDQGNTVIAEWYFRYGFKGKRGEFDGVSVIDFEENGRIVRLCEYKAEHKHVCPFG